MTQSDQEPLDPAVIDALRADFQRPDGAVRERVSARLAGRVGALALHRSLSAAPGSATVPALALRSLSLLASFVLGGLCGAGLYGALRAPPPARVVYVERPPVLAIAPSTSATAASAVASAPLVLPSAPSAVVKSLAVVGSANTLPSASADHAGFASLAEQQALLDVARAAFARSDYPATLNTLKTHFQRYPKSVLGEEREALEIKALAGSGRVSEAQTRAARFKTQFPQSLLLPSVNDSLGVNP